MKSIFKLINKDNSPVEVYNHKFIISVFLFGISGILTGLDEGNITSNVTLVSFQDQFGLSDSDSEDLESNITTIVILASILGSFLSYFVADRFGRLNCLRCSLIGVICAVIIEVSSYSIVPLYIGRFIEGVFLGMIVVICPLYLSEISPKNIRGFCGCIFSSAFYCGIMISSLANYITAITMSDQSRFQWIIPTSIKFIFCTTIFIFSFLFGIESPLWLIKKNDLKKAIETLSYLRHLPIDNDYIVSEINDINDQLVKEEKEFEGETLKSIFRDIIFVKSIRYRLLLGFSAQCLAQWSGDNAITDYSPELFELINKYGNEKLLMSAFLNLVKFASTLFTGFFILDYLGRRKSLYIGLTIQLISITFFATFLLIVNTDFDANSTLSTSERVAGRVTVAMLFFNGIGWTLGFHTIQYLINSEMFPLKVRNVANSLTMMIHFANQYGSTKSLNQMESGMKDYGAFYFYAGILVLSIFWTWFFLPELSSRSLESMDDLFNLPWYLIGREGNQMRPDATEINRITSNSANCPSQVYNDGPVEYRFSNQFISEDLSSDIILDAIMMKEEEDKPQEVKTFKLGRYSISIAIKRVKRDSESS